MRRQCFFDLARPHLEATGFDQVFLPVDDEDITILIHVAQIARMKPALRAIRIDMIAKDLARFFRTIPETDHQLRPGKTDLANFSRGHHSRALVRVEDPHVNVRERHADRSCFVRTLDRIHTERHHRFGQ